MRKLLIISTFTFVVSMVNAQQQDSLVDVFPLVQDWEILLQACSHVIRIENCHFCCMSKTRDPRHLDVHP